MPIPKARHGIGATQKTKLWTWLELVREDLAPPGNGMSGPTQASVDAAVRASDRRMAQLAVL